MSVVVESVVVEQRWPSILKERAEHLRSVALSARVAAISRELDELAELYEDTAGRLAARAAIALHVTSRWPRSDVKDELVTHLQQKAHDFLRQAWTTADRSQADHLRSLSASFGAEAARLQSGAF